MKNYIALMPKFKSATIKKVYIFVLVFKFFKNASACAVMNRNAINNNNRYNNNDFRVLTFTRRNVSLTF